MQSGHLVFLWVSYIDIGLLFNGTSGDDNFSPGSSRQPRSGHAPQPTTPSGVPTHPGKQLSAVFVGRPRGRLNTDHDSDADRVGPNSGQPGNTTPRGPSPPRSIVRRALQLASSFAQHPLRQSHFCALCHSAPAPPCQHTSAALYTHDI